jgi:hypothetical protein
MQIKKKNVWSLVGKKEIKIPPWDNQNGKK